MKNSDSLGNAPIFLVGFPGCGKTTFGRALAKALGRQFIDLDFYIVQRFRKTVSEIFAERGEAGFRAVESAMLREAGEFDSVVVACGGGTPCSPGNMDYMNSRGLTVCLRATDGRLFERLSRGRAKRPLIAAMTDPELRSYIVAKQAEREPFYSQARMELQADRLESKQQIAATLQEFLQTL